MFDDPTLAIIFYGQAGQTSKQIPEENYANGREPLPSGTTGRIYFRFKGCIVFPSPFNI